MQGKKLYRIPKCHSLTTPKFHTHFKKLSDSYQTWVDLSTSTKFRNSSQKKYSKKKTIANLDVHRSSSIPNKRSLSTHKTSSLESKSTTFKQTKKSIQSHYCIQTKQLRKIKQLIRSQSKKLKIQDRNDLQSIQDVNNSIDTLNQQLQNLRKNKILKPLIQSIQQNYQSIIDYLKISNSTLTNKSKHFTINNLKDNFKGKLKLDLQSVKKMPILDYHTEFMQNTENFSQSWLLDLEKEKKS